MNKCVFIAVSYNDGPVFNHFERIGSSFVNNGYELVYIFDNKIKGYPAQKDNFYYYTWPSKRPTNLIDFIFLNNLIKKHKPSHCISNFGAVNVMTLVSLINGVKNRIIWIHTTSSQIMLDSNNKLKSILLKYRKTIIYKMATKIFTNSNGTRKDSITNFGIPTDKIIVLHNSLNKSVHDYTRLKDRKPFITIVGRLDKSKGHMNLIKQFHSVVKKYPELRLNIVGDGPLKKQLIKQVLDLNLERHTVFHGNIPNKEVSKLFSVSIIGVSSSFSEAFGYVNIEALREGTPIISTKTEGAIDIIEDGVNGLFFEHTNELSLLHAVDKIIPNWGQFSQGSLKTFDKKFNLDVVVDEHFRLLEC